MFIISNRPLLRNRGLTLGGNTLTLAIFHEEELAILSIIKNAPRRGEVYLGAVDISVSPAGSIVSSGSAALPVFNHRINFNPIETETFKLILPFEGSDFFVRLRAGDEERAFRVQASE